VQLPKRRVCVFERLSAVSAKIVSGLLQLLPGSLQGSDSRANVRMARLSYRKCECSGDGHSGQETFKGVFHEYNVAKREAESSENQEGTLMNAD
jgi:hypothetical protein